MIKKLAAVLLTIFIVLLWVTTLRGLGPIQPIDKQIKLGLDISGGVSVVMKADTTNVPRDQLATVMSQTQSVIEQRVNSLGVSEPVVTVEGSDRIRIELPGMEKSSDAIDAIGRVAQLKFTLADNTLVMDGKDIKDARVDTDNETGGYVVTLNFTGDGQKKFYEGTQKAYAQTITTDQIMKTSDGAVAMDVDDNPVQANSIVIFLDDEIISAPVVDEGPINGTSCIIRGSFTADEAKNLAMLIRGGALPVPLSEQESSEIGATLGMGALQDALLGGIIGIGLIMLLFLFMYRLLGLAASLAVMLYIPTILWIMVIIKGVMTLPGIAGIILSIGMAVDCNVIIFARIKEEVANGKSIRVAASTGFNRAMTTIVDSQLTTIIAAVILYALGTGPVKGFALTLIIGIIVGVVAAVLATHLYTTILAESPAITRSKLLVGMTEGLDIGQMSKPRFNFKYIDRRKIYYIVTVAIIVVGIGVGLVRGYNWGIDFTGGTVMQVNMHKAVTSEEVDKVMNENGIDDAEITTYGDSGIVIKTTADIKNVQRQKLIDSFSKTFDLDPEKDFPTFDYYGPSIGDMLKKNAITATLIAALCMLIYAAFRFKWRLGVASLVGVLHDVIMMISLYGLFHLTINNPFIAAILTIVGYSINDTIVIFDRIRENMGLMSRLPLNELVDVSINQTLVRSLMTSACTALAILPLIFIGGDSIKQFTIPLLIGIVCGAASSIFVASPIFFELSAIGEGSRRNRTRGRYAAAQSQQKLSRKPANQLPASKPGRKTAEEDCCGKCGAPMPEGAVFCFKCGTRVQRDDGNGNGLGNDKKDYNAKGKRKKSKKQRKNDGPDGGAVV